ncbi:hydantoinase/oxoprolinase family protein [Herbaspirillum sp. YR522]|uniref:hydantoinase/oxoprolinase family protein n=1 Tax=Herbaspirillum sp. YR522 TaxID=1144342 RepID=UPI00026FB3E2|nr:hydantoinase/oxoprolinase family protein [Herbaspirillum sp. YR522]EJM97733.1 N-methylhydantoinase A/acetone carboxylase, beta subunit [Herbaspirillum sp. YR522]
MNPVPSAGARIGIDVGGTFTDFVLYHPQRQQFAYHKQPSTPADPALAVRDGLAALIAKCGLAPSDVAVLMHGTTIGLNAIIQRRGARVALVTSEGFRDVLEIGRARMPSSFDFHATREEPFLSRERVIEIGARFDRKGQVTRWPHADEIAAVATQLGALGADAVVLMLINGYLQPEREAELAQALQAALPASSSGVAVLSAAQTWPEIREYERTVVASLNAYIQPLMQRYFERLEQLAAELGVSAPILVTASNGGSLSLRGALARPIDTVLSGPASGVVAAARLAVESGTPGIVTFDMGGTSSDIAVSRHGQAEMVTRTEIGGLPLVLPVVGVSAIGAGGGSRIRVDAHGVLKVGPESAGADPGPACYGRGGLDATVTDCYLATGVLDPDAFVGGSMQLYPQHALQALAQVAQALGQTDQDAPVRAAAGALAIATAQMASELRKSLAQRGLDPAEFALVPFGGAGPTHANWLAEEAGLKHVLVPQKPGTFCALGAATSDLRRDFVRSLRVAIDDASAGEVGRIWAALGSEATQWLAQQGVQEASGAPQLRHALDMRYAGQAYELNVALPETLPTPLDAAVLREAFHREHERLYGFRDQQAPVEVSTIRLAIVGRLAKAASPQSPAGSGRPVPRARRQVYLRGAWQDTGVFDRSALGTGDLLDGPAVIEQEDTTIVLLPGWQGHTDQHGNLHLRPASSHGEAA